MELGCLSTRCALIYGISIPLAFERNFLVLFFSGCSILNGPMIYNRDPIWSELKFWNSSGVSLVKANGICSKDDTSFGLAFLRKSVIMSFSAKFAPLCIKRKFMLICSCFTTFPLQNENAVSSHKFVQRPKFQSNKE